MSYYNGYSANHVSGTIIGTSCASILGALPLIGLTFVSKPARPASRGTRITWYLTGFATLILLSSHIAPLVAATRYFLEGEPVYPLHQDIGSVTFALQGLVIIFEIAACRSVFYSTLPLGVTRKKKWTFIILDMLSFGALVGTFIGGLVGTADYHSGICYNNCSWPREVATIFFDNVNSSGGMHGTSVFSLIVVLAGAIYASRWSPNSHLARSLRISLPLLATIQLALTLTCIFVATMIFGSESTDENNYDPIYYATIPFWFIQLFILWFVQLALRSNPTGLMSVEETDSDVALKEQPMGGSEPTETA